MYLTRILQLILTAFIAFLSGQVCAEIQDFGNINKQQTTAGVYGVQPPVSATLKDGNHFSNGIARVERSRLGGHHNRKPSKGGGGYTHITAPVPEPETYAMILAGLGLIGLSIRHRKQAP